jgi:hypothetical protein
VRKVREATRRLHVLEAGAARHVENPAAGTRRSATTVGTSTPLKRPSSAASVAIQDSATTSEILRNFLESLSLMTD